MNKIEKISLIIGGIFLLTGIIVIYDVENEKKTSAPKVLNQEAQKSEAKSSTLKNPKKEIIEKRGKYLGHNFSIMNKEEGNKYIATFTPFLSRNDTEVLGAISKVINLTFGNHTITNLEPQIKRRKGTNLLKFNGTGGDYYVLLIKEHTGEIHSFTFWKE